MNEQDFEPQRAFGGIDRLYGAGTLARLQRVTVTVVGIGGVGSWCAEALARCGVGALRLIDMDHVSESNLNRQLPALTSTIGRAKIAVMAERIKAINPYCAVECVDAFVDPENVATLLPRVAFGVVVDCADAVRAKAAIIAHCDTQATAVITCGAAGGKRSPASLNAIDIADATHDPLLASLRHELRRRYGYPPRGKTGVRCVTTNEPRLGAVGTGGLACAGYGSIVTMTATMGMIAADEVLRMALRMK